jgi:pimeloyl-ACP methyl ester carboxylesterase
MHNVTVNGINTHYYVAGRGSDAVLFLHGWASSGRMWLRSMWALRREFRLWAPDLPGFGASDGPHFEWYSIERYTDHIVGFCQALDIRPRYIVGHSMGGRIMFDLARRCPTWAERLVAVSPTITGRLGFNLNVFLTSNLGATLMGLSRKVWPIAVAGAMSNYLAPYYLGTEAVTRTADDLRRSKWRAVVATLQAVINQDYSPHLAEISQPTLVICGRRDFTVPPSDSHIAARHLPRARLMLLDRVHHQPADEAPTIFIDAVRDFLRNGASEAA